MGEYGQYGPLVKGALALAAVFWAGAAQAACRLALVLALDVSGSVDEREYLVQLNGVATALEDRAVREALLALPDAPVALAIFEWSSASYQRDILGWTMLAGEVDLAAVVARLRGWRRDTAPEATGIGAALEYAAGMLRAGPVCWAQTVDVSGDGRNNDWPVPRDVRASGMLAGVTINALAVGQELQRSGDLRRMGIAELTAYYRAELIQGPGAFVEVALGYDDYARAMTRKLLREISAPPLGHLRPAPRRYAGQFAADQ
ncbi:MAG: DUF1194 domain-containing protein [Pseudomonadota bacterium]